MDHAFRRIGMRRSRVWASHEFFHEHAPLGRSLAPPLRALEDTGPLGLGRSGDFICPAVQTIGSTCFGPSGPDAQVDFRRSTRRIQVRRTGTFAAGVVSPRSQRHRQFRARGADIRRATAVRMRFTQSPRSVRPLFGHSLAADFSNAAADGVLRSGETGPAKCDMPRRTRSRRQAA